MRNTIVLVAMAVAAVLVFSGCDPEEHRQYMADKWERCRQECPAETKPALMPAGSSAVLCCACFPK